MKDLVFLSGRAVTVAKGELFLEGVKGWGAKGDLDLGLIERLAKEK